MFYHQTKSKVMKKFLHQVIYSGSLTLFLCFSCQQEEIATSESSQPQSIKKNSSAAQSNHITITEAEQFYVKYTHEKANSSGRKSSENRHPLWKYAKEVYIDGKTSVVMAPIMYDNEPGFIIKDDREKKSERGGKSIRSGGLDSYIIVKKDSSNNKSIDICNIVSSIKHLRTKKGKKSTSDFDGYVFYTNWENEKKASFIIEDGIVTGSSYANKGARRAFGCTYVCTEWYDRVSFNGVTYEWRYQRLDCETFCFQETGSTYDNPDAYFSQTRYTGLGGGTTLHDEYMTNPEYSSYFNYRLNPTEKEFFRNNPSMLVGVMDNANAATSAVRAVYNTDADDVEANAFKHAFWSAMNTKMFGDNMAEVLGDNHEAHTIEANKANMDRYNNAVGIEVFNDNQSRFNYVNRPEAINLMLMLVADAMKAGRGIYINPDGYSQTNGSTITNSAYK
jgi:hypothetical protein